MDDTKLTLCLLMLFVAGFALMAHVAEKLFNR